MTPFLSHQGVWSLALALLAGAGCVGGLPENAYRSTFGMDRSERAYAEASELKRRNYAKEVKAFAQKQAAWQERAKAQEAKRCKITVAEIAAVRASFSATRVEDTRGRTTDFPLPKLHFDEQLVRDGNCIASYKLNRVTADLNLAEITLALPRPWEGTWQAGSGQPLPNVVFRTRIVGYQSVSKPLGLRMGDDNLAIVVDALSRDSKGGVAVQLSLHNQGERSLRLTSLAVHVHHAYGSLDVGAEPPLQPSEQNSLLLEVQDLSVVSPAQEVVRIFGYGGPPPATPVLIMVKWAYVVSGKELHQEQTAAVSLASG